MIGLRGMEPEEAGRQRRLSKIFYSVHDVTLSVGNRYCKWHVWIFGNIGDPG
jgi:hypothetical protein